MSSELIELGVFILRTAVVSATEYLVDRARSKTVKSINDQNEIPRKLKSFLQTSIDQLKDQLKKRLDSLGESNLRAAVSYVKDALILIHINEENRNVKEINSNQFIPHTFQFSIPDDAMELLKQARAWAQLAFSDPENVSVPMRIEAIKIQIFCILLLYKDDEKKCMGLIAERIGSLLDDQSLKSFLDKKLSRFSFFNNKTVVEAKTSIGVFAREIIRALPNLHKLGYRLKDVPPFMTCLTSQACIPVGWWEGHAVVWVNGTMMCDVPWAQKILVGDFVGKTKLLDLDTFQFQKTYDVALELNSIVDENLQEIYSGQNLFKWKEKNGTFKLKHGYEKGVSYSNPKLNKSVIKGPSVTTPSKHTVLLTSEGLFVRWTLQLVNNEGMDHILDNDFKKSVQMFVPIESADVSGVNRILWAEEDLNDDRIFVYALKFAVETVGEVWKFIINRNSTFGGSEKLYYLPGIDPENCPDFYHDLLCWSDVNESTVGVSLNKHGVFQLRLLDTIGNCTSHSMVSISDFTVFPPLFRWKSFDPIEKRSNNVSERTVYKRSAILKDGCVFICRPFEYSLMQQQINALNADIINYRTDTMR